MTNLGDAPSNIALTAATVLRIIASVSATADLTLSTTATNITGAAWTVTQDGNYLLLPVWTSRTPSRVARRWLDK